MDSDLMFSLSYSELLALHSCVSTISCVYGEDEIRSGLLFTLTEAIAKASRANAVILSVDA